MSLPIYVIGHKNPDTDSICAALALAELKRQTGINAVAARLGTLNPETKFILDKLHVNMPVLLTTARSTLEEIEIDDAVTIEEGQTIRRAWDLCLENHVKTLYVVDDKNEYKGMVTLGDVSKIQMQDLNITSELLKETLHKYTDLSVKDLDIKPVVGMKEPEHYRHIVAFPITYFSGKLCVGVYQRETKFLTLMDHCPLQTKKINSLLVKIEDILNANNCRDYNDKFKKGLRFLIVRQIGEEMQVAFVTGQDGISQTVTKEIAALDEVTALYYTVNTSRYQDFYEQGFKRIYGQTHAKYKDFKISVRSDMILNPEMDDEKTRQIASLLDKKEEVLSMGCGSGIMELQLENKVVAIDDNKVSIHDATENAKRLELDNKLFVAGHVNDQAAHHLKNHKYDALIINETVDGMTEDLLKSITLSGIKHLIIVSDNMSTLAKTLHQLEEMYDVNTIISLDKEPHTPRLEIIVDLKRK